MKKLIAAVAALSVGGCLKVPPAPTAKMIHYPEGVWTTRPVPFGYAELGPVRATDWTLTLALERAVAASKAAGGVGVIDAKWTVEDVLLPLAECKTTPGCVGGDAGDPAKDYYVEYEDGPTPGTAHLWTVDALAVRPYEVHDAPAPSSTPATSP